MTLKKYKQTQNNPKVSVTRKATYKFSRRKWHMPSLSQLYTVTKQWFKRLVTGLKFVACIGFLVLLNGYFKQSAPPINYSENYTVVVHKTVCDKSTFDIVSCEKALDTAARYHQAAVWQISDGDACKNLHMKCEPSTRTHGEWQPSIMGYAVFKKGDELSALPFYQNTIVEHFTFPNGAPVIFYEGKVKNMAEGMSIMRVYSNLSDNVCPDSRPSARTKRTAYAKRLMKTYSRIGKLYINPKDWLTC